MTDICIVTPGLSDNSLGRTFCIWLLCVSAGLTTRVISPAPSEDIWEPLRGSEFAAACENLSVYEAGNKEKIAHALDEARGIIVIKAIPESFGLVRALLKGRSNVVVDIDDPDLEAATSWMPLRDQVRAMTDTRYWRMRWYRQNVKGYPVMVSNPVLQQMYGGVVVPHVRVDTGPGEQHERTGARVAFIGTAKAHKGIETLRAAVDRLANQGYELDVTALAPPDARGHERWHGFTSFDRGLELTAHADIVAVPSLAGSYADAQFPVKIVDALLLARPVVASDVGPISWALGGGGVLFPPGDVSALSAALLELRDPTRRQALGETGRAHALKSFTVDTVLPAFRKAVVPRLLPR